MIGWGEDGQVTIRQSLFYLPFPSKVRERESGREIEREREKEREQEREIIPPDIVTPTVSTTPELE